MKTYITTCFLLVTGFILAQPSYSHFNISTPNPIDEIGANGYDFMVTETNINTKYSEIGSGLFMDKLVMVSSKKIGAIGSGIDENTNEPFTDLYCLDIIKNGDLRRPLLFSRILNTKDNEGQITFSNNQNTIYFTRSSRENSKNYQLYKAVMDKNIMGNWINEEKLSISSDYYSIESPFVNGNKLYFSSNMQGSLGGYDLFVCNIKEDGTLGEPKNLGTTINTDKDEKYPFISKDNQHFYFSSKGHRNIGGYDVFTSRIVNEQFKSPRNLGNTVNTKYDEIAFFLTNDYQGYLTSNKTEGAGSYDIYKFDKSDVIQYIEGLVVDKDTQIPLPNTLVILTDEEGREIGRQFTGEDAKYNFPVTAFDAYNIATTKNGFINANFDFEANSGKSTTYNKNLELVPTKAIIIEVKNKKMIAIENIYFDFDKWTIKQESTISLNKVLDVLNANQDMKIEINAHTDNKGKRRYNQILSEKRAASAMQFLINKGVDTSRLISHGFGEDQPIIDCENECSKADDQTNRRIEFVIIE